MNKKSYSQILDVVAGDHVPQSLDLAPHIIARIQKDKGVRMQSRTKLIPAILLIVIAIVVLFFTVPGVAAAIQRWFGYVPGVGLVSEGQIRVLADPVSMTREGVKVTVDQVVLDPEKTVLIYTVDGIPNTAYTTTPQEICSYTASLRLPDGQVLSASPDGIQGWGTGYQHRFNYSAIPAAVNDAQFMISCLFSTRPGSAPENWEIPLHFVAAPPDMTAFPVIEIATPTPLAPTAAPVEDATAEPATQAAATHTPAAISMSLTLDRAVQMDDGYLIYATLHWKDTPFEFVDVTDIDGRLHLLDASGQEMRYEVQYDDQTGGDAAKRQTVFAIKTAPVQADGPLTLVVDSVTAEMQGNATFVFDPGPDPKPGQTWSLNQEVKIGDYNLRIQSATASDKGYSFEMTSDNGIVHAILSDPAHPPMGGGGGGGGGGTLGTIFSSGFDYSDGLHSGPITVSVMIIGVEYQHPLRAEWTPPAASLSQLPTQPAACLTTASWKAAKSQKPTLPADLTGKVLTNGPVDNANGAWGLTLSKVDGSNRQVIEDARDGSISPDGTKLAYSSLSAGISIKDLATGAVAPLAGTADGDFNPFWSPDGQQIVFNRGMGIFDLFIVNLDGSNMRQLTHGGVQEWPIGWLANGQLLYTVPGREYEYTNYQIDVQSGVSQQSSQDNLQSTSPDGKYIVTTEHTFGDRWMTYVSELDGSNRWLLASSDLWVLNPIWSPDGQWLLASVSDTDSASAIGAMISLRTCQVIPLPDIKGNILSWVP